MATLCIAAAICDIRSRRIPNWLTATATGIGIGISAIDGPHALLLYAAVFGVSLAVGFILYLIGGIGGGDVKLLIAGCALAGYPGALTFLMWVSVCGGVQAALTLAYRRETHPGIQTLLIMPQLARMGYTGLRIPYGVAIAGGALCFLLATTYVPQMRL